MNASRLIDRMQRFPAALNDLLHSLPDADARWKPPSGAWSILEIVNHLADEEAEDFRARLERTLRDPEEDWPPIDPEGWADSRAYNQRDLADSLDRFARERAESMAWLRSLQTPDWTRARVHPRFGPIRAGDLLASWAAHDALHLRQLSKRLFELARRDSDGFSTGYAGDWGP